MVSLNDFRLRDSDLSEQACAAAFAGQSKLTPYCLDHKNRRMIFAETPGELNVSTAPFYYQAQYEAATRLIAVPYDQVHRIAAQLPARFEQLVFIFSVGRCGSTLLSKVWQRLDDTCSLSEPDIFTDINYLRGERRLTEPEALQLLDSAIRLFSPPTRYHARLVIKFRAQCIGLAELIHRLCPNAGFIFMYRNAIDCIDSYLRVFGELPLPEPLFRQAFSYAASQPEVYNRLRKMGQPLLVWLVCAHDYLRQRQASVPFVALKYEELVRNSHDSVGKMFAHCGAHDADIGKACGAMTEDPQAGTRLARNADGRRTLTPDDVQFVRAFFARHSAIAPDPTFAGTLNCA